MSYEWKQGKMERLTVKIVLISFSLVFLTSCSSEPSAQEKRNQFDACVIEKLKEYADTTGGQYYEKLEIFRSFAEMKCADYLK